MTNESVAGELTDADQILGRLESSDPDFDDCADAATLIRKLVADRALRQSDAQAAIAKQSELIVLLKQEAQIHAQEAKTANATIYEIYQCVTGATGEPGNWHGAEPVRAALAAKDAQLAALTAERDALRKDKDRLDRFDQQATTYGFEGVQEGNEWLMNGPFASLRIAIDECCPPIDAAMTKDTK